MNNKKMGLKRSIQEVKHSVVKKTDEMPYVLFFFGIMKRFLLLTCIFPSIPVLSIRLATFTVFPQISYCGFCAPMTPAMTGPWLIPAAEHAVIIGIKRPYVFQLLS